MNDRRRSDDLVDLTLKLPSHALTFPGDRAMTVDGPWSHVPGGVREYCYDLSFSTQVGTHVQGAHYFLSDGKRILDYPLSRFEGPAHVVDCPHRRIEFATLREQLPKPPWDQLMLLLRTGYSARLLERWLAGGALTFDDLQDKPGLSVEAAQGLLENGLRFLGIDAPGIERYPSDDHAVNVLFCKHDVILLENLVRLEALPTTGAWLSCFPLPVEGVEGTPCRAVARLRGKAVSAGG